MYKNNDAERDPEEGGQGETMIPVYQVVELIKTLNLAPQSLAPAWTLL